MSTNSIESYNHQRTSRRTGLDLVLIFPTWSCICPATNFLNVTFFVTLSSLSESFSYLTGCCISCILLLPKFQSIFNPCNPLNRQTTGNNINVKNNKTRPIFFGIQLMHKKKKNFLVFKKDSK